MNTIAELFVRPIDRNINGVIKVGQQDASNVLQELDEYVVTREVDRELRKFFGHYSGTLSTSTDKIGVWISGFFGSGKSHFLKILSYLLANRGIEGQRAVDFFGEGKVPDAMLRAEIERVARAADHTDVILFNIDAKADAESKAHKEAVVRVMLKAFDEHLGYLATSPEMAAMERQLDGRGQYAAFKDAFSRQTGLDWVAERDAWAFHQGEIVTALGSLGLSEGEATRWLDTLSVQQGVSPESFGQLVSDYLNRRGPEQRVIFMVDEVGQYVGDNSSLMLNLQSVTEELGVRCPGRAWVIVTSQEDIDSVMGGKVKSNDFSKIQGRFNTRISLSSGNTDEVIQLRLLNKTPDGERALEALYDSQQAILRNQLTFSSDNASLPGYKDARTFVSSYPFVPYQFALLQKAFTAIRTTGHSGKHLAEGERSMLNAFQEAATQYGGAGLGALVPFQAFYAPVEGFLDSSVRRVIDQARDNPSLEAQDTELLKTLFLIKHVKEIKSNLENLTTLSLTQIDQDKVTLRQSLEDSLARLERQTLIARNGDTYVFLTHEEQDVGREIKHIEVAASELTAELQGRVWESIFPLKALKYDAYHNYSFNRKLDASSYGQQTSDISLQIVTPYADRYDELRHEQAALLASGGGTEAFVILQDEDTLFTELSEMVKTEKYLKKHSGSGSSASLRSILQARAEENSHRKERVETQLRAAIASARVYASGARLSTGGTDPREVLTLALRTLVDNGYQKLGYINKPHLTEGDLTRALTSGDDGVDLNGQVPNQMALLEIERHLNEQAVRNLRVTLRSLVEGFSRRPFGWSETEILGLTATLVARGQADLRRAQSTVNPGEKGLAATLQKRSAQDEITVRLSEVISPVAMKAARELGRDYFEGETLPPEAPRLVASFREKLARDQEQFRGYQERAARGYPFGPGLAAALTLTELLLKSEGTAGFLNTLKAQQEAFEDLIDLQGRLKAFYKGTQLGIFDQARRDLDEMKTDLTRVNVPELLKRVEKAQQVLAMDDPTTQIPALSGLLNPVREHIAALLADSKVNVLAAWEAEAARLLKLGQEIGADETKALILTFVATKDEIARATTIDGTEAIQFRLQERAKAAELAIENRINELSRPTPIAPSGGSAVKPPVDLPPVVVTKPIRRLKPSDVLKGKDFIETVQDIDAYLGLLRTQLEKAVQSGERVRLE